MAEIPDVSFGEVVASEWGNDIRDRTVMRYANQGALDASIPTPVAGDLAWLNDVARVKVYTGAAWVVVGQGEFLKLVGGNMTGPINHAAYDEIGIEFLAQAVAGFNFLGAANGDLQVRRGATGYLTFRQGNNIEALQPLRVQNGLPGTPSYSFANSTGLGIYRNAANDMRFSASNAEKFSIRTAGVGSTAIYNATTGSSPNVFIVGTSFLMQRSTSARKYKSDIKDASHLKDLDLAPVTFHHDGDDKDYIGFVADDMPDERAKVYEDEGIENYDLRAVVAILAAKVNDLETRLAALEG